MQINGGTSVPESDQFFNPLRLPHSQRALSFVNVIIEEVDARIQRTRQRKRRSIDQEKFELTLRAVISDVAYQTLRHGQGTEIAVRRGKDHLTPTARYGAPAMNNTLPNLLDATSRGSGKLLRQRIGERNPLGRGSLTTISATPRLRERMAALGLTSHDFTKAREREVIVLNGHKSGTKKTAPRLEYTDTKETLGYRAEVESINDGLAEAEIDLVDTPHGQPWLDHNDRHIRRMFNRQSFTNGGRLFGGFWQSMSKADRHEHILIEGEQVTTLDYCQIAPHIAYGLAGCPSPKGDLYFVDGLEGYRDGVKKFLNALFFDPQQRTRKPRHTSSILPANFSAVEITDLIKQRHKDISHLFGTGIGHSLQFTESQVLVRVLLELKDQHIVALPIHDAVVVKQSDCEAVKATMTSVFESVVGAPIEVSLG